MKKLLLFALAIVFTLNTYAQLAYDQAAPLIEHMADVNKEWLHYQGPVSDMLEPISFSNENERIARHLELVEAHLRANVQKGLSDGQARERAESLDALNLYWKEARFPINLYHKVRQPYFIDHYNTACAVGHLMRESGHGALAEVVKENMNYAYVREIPYPELLEWAGANGFTQDELAWIQPGYPPSSIWNGFGSSMDNNVTVVYVDDNTGDMYVGGEFTTANAVSSFHVAKWNGSTFEAFGVGLNGIVHDLIVYNGDLYAGGEFNGGLNDLAKWDGNQWNYSIVFQGTHSMIFDLHIHNNDLFAAGGGAGFAGISYYVAGTSSGSSWSFVGGEFDEAVYTLSEHNGSLAAGGDFTYNNDLGGMSMNHVASYFGTAWWELGGGLDNTVHTLLYRNNALFAGGEMEVDSLNQTFGLAHLDDMGMAWENDIQSSDYSNYQGEKYISSLVDINGQLYAGGSFLIDQIIGTYGGNIGMVDEVNNGMSAIATLNGKVNAVAGNGSTLIMGGEFTNANFTLVNYLAQTDVSTGIEDLDEFDISIINDQVNDLLYIDLENSNGERLFCDLIDINGKQIKTGIAVVQGRTTVDLQSLSVGTYVVTLVSNGRNVKSEKIIKQ